MLRCVFECVCAFGKGGVMDKVGLRRVDTHTHGILSRMSLTAHFSSERHTDTEKQTVDDGGECDTMCRDNSGSKDAAQKMRKTDFGNGGKVEKLNGCAMMTV